MFTWLVFSYQVMSDSLQPHGLQHARLSCPSLSPWICPNSCPLDRWWHLIISSSVTPFSYPQSFLASGSFPMSWLFPSCGQSIGAWAWASASVLPMNIQRGFPLWLTGLISLLSKGLLRSWELFNFNLSVFKFLAFALLFRIFLIPRFSQWGTISCQSEWLLFKSLQAINAGEVVEKRELSYTVGGNAN